MDQIANLCFLGNYMHIFFKDFHDLFFVSNSTYDFRQSRHTDLRQLQRDVPQPVRYYRSQKALLQVTFHLQVCS